MSQPKRARARRQPAGSTVPDDLAGARSSKSPIIPRPPRMPSDAASLPRAPLDLGELKGFEGTFTDGEAAAETLRCEPQPLSAERPTVPSPPSKTSGIRVR